MLLQKNTFLIKTALLFIATYFVFIIVWMALKNPYGHLIAKVASSIVSLTKDVKVTDFKVHKESATITLSPERFKAIEEITIGVKVSAYTFNVPLTFAIMIAFYPALLRKFNNVEKHKKKRTQFLKFYLNAFFILLAIHLSYIYSLESVKMAELMVLRGYESPQSMSFVFTQSLWLIVDNMFIRYEPFIVGMYLYIRFFFPVHLAKSN